MQPYGQGPRRKDLRRTRRGIKTGRRATHPVETAYGRGQERRDHELRWAAQAWLTGLRAAVPATVTVLITDATGNAAELVIDPAEPMTNCPNSLVKALRGRR
jgi:hypothetical protein